MVHREINSVGGRGNNACSPPTKERHTYTIKSHLMKQDWENTYWPLNPVLTTWVSTDAVCACFVHAELVFVFNFSNT
jgi:hypothetical protein